MPHSLKVALCQIPREIAGARTADLFDYQLDWAFSKLISLHEGDDDYMMMLDYHDDVVVTDSADDPKEVRCYQVKTRTRDNWTVVNLTSRSADGLSIIGRLFDHRLRFGDGVAELAFVSNQRFRVTLSGRGRSTPVEEVECVGLSDEERLMISEAVRAEHNLEEAPDVSGLSLRHAGLPIRGHGVHVEGLLSRFLTRRVPDSAFKVSSAFTSIKDELRRKNNLVVAPQSYQELANKKGITRSEFASHIARICRTANPQERWRALNAMLASSGVAHLRRQRLSAEFKRVDAQLMDPAYTIVQQAYELATAALRTGPPVYDETDNTATVLRKVAEHLITELPIASILSHDHAEAVVLHAMDDL